MNIQAAIMHQTLIIGVALLPLALIALGLLVRLSNYWQQRDRWL